MDKDMDRDMVRDTLEPITLNIECSVMLLEIR